MSKKKEPERHDRSWRDTAKGKFKVVIQSADRAMRHLEAEDDYFAQVEGHSALEHCAEALGNIAAAIERKPKK
jgi:hypothetical protein